jgi:Protein of unknown function (DUF559)
VLKARQLGVTFRRQVSVGGQFIADFLAPSVRLRVDVDGAYHARRQGADAKRGSQRARCDVREDRAQRDGSGKRRFSSDSGPRSQPSPSMYEVRLHPDGWPPARQRSAKCQNQHPRRLMLGTARYSRAVGTAAQAKAAPAGDDCALLAESGHSTASGTCITRRPSFQNTPACVPIQTLRGSAWGSSRATCALAVSDKLP